MRWLASSIVALFALYSSATALGLSPLIIHTNPVVKLQVEVMDTPEKRAEGMMFKESWGKRGGMLFIFDEPFQAIMWMKNTPLPMDMIFIGTDNTVKYIAERTTPYSTDYIIGPEITAAVLEVPAGFAQKHSIKAGHAITLPISH